MKKNKGGRPTKMTQNTVEKLEEAFAFGATDIEACFYADIHRSTLYSYEKDHPEFIDRKELLKARPILKARQAVVQGFTDDPTLALKYLERKLKDEFSLRRENDNTNYNFDQTVEIDIIEDEKGDDKPEDS